MIFQQANERCYHIFYQLLAGASQEALNELLLTNQVKDYHFVSQGAISVDGVDDAAMYKQTKVCCHDNIAGLHIKVNVQITGSNERFGVCSRGTETAFQNCGCCLPFW